MDGQTSFASPSTFGSFGGGNFGLPVVGSGSSFSTPSFTSGGTAEAFGPPPGSTMFSAPAPSGGSATSGPGMSTGQMVGIGAGIAGLAGMSGLFGGNKGSQVNIDPYGLGAQAASEAQMLWKTYNTGSLMPGDQARIAQWQQSQTQAVKDYYSKAGLSDSSMAKEALGQVGQQADSMRAQANQNLLQPAMQATGMANQYARDLVNYQIMQDQQKQQAQSQFFNTIAQVGMMAAFA